uniref:Uncharacterized protein n=1 Tax=viral metagenome TaxID=1070528 RepID=A0A6C0I307_9ZZZZ
MNPCSYLTATTLFLLFPVYFYFQSKSKNTYETALVSLLVINIILSFLFWNDPKPQSVIHTLDGIFAKLSFVLFSIYILFIKDIHGLWWLISLFLFMLSATAFYVSNMHSKIDWCSRDHLLFHAIFHILISLGCSIAFIPIYSRI